MAGRSGSTRIRADARIAVAKRHYQADYVWLWAGAGRATRRAAVGLQVIAALLGRGVGRLVWVYPDSGGRPNRGSQNALSGTLFRVLGWLVVGLGRGWRRVAGHGVAVRVSRREAGLGLPGFGRPPESR